MRISGLSIAASIIVLATCLPAFAESAHSFASASVDVWMRSVDAEATISTESLTGTNVDLIDDLGLDDSASTAGFGARLDLPLFPEINISYLAIDDEADKVITGTYVINGNTYTAGDSVSSSYDFTEYEATFGFGIIKQEWLSLALLLGAKYFDIQTTLKDNTSGASFDESVEFGIPVVGAKAEIGLPAKFKLGAGARGMSLDISDVDATVWNADIALHYDPLRFLRLSAGYRYEIIDCEATDENDSIDITFAGPFVGVTASF